MLPALKTRSLGEDVTTTGLQKTAYVLLLALMIYAWVVGG